MRLAAFDVYRYQVPLTPSLRLNTGTLHHREGLLIRWTSDTGAVGWGEAAPLPGFSHEPLDEVEAILRRLQTEWIGWEWGPIDAVIDAVEAPAFQEMVSEQPLASSVRFGIELAYADLVAAEAGCTLPQVLGPHPRSSLALNGLLMRDGAEVVEQAVRLREAGYAAVKLKVGRGRVADEASLVRRLADALGSDVALRLDANRAWTLADALAFAEAVDGVPIQYIEEPLARPDDLPVLAEQARLPLALDESLVGMPAADLRRHVYARAIVLKPTLVGGLRRSLQLGRLAQQLGMLPVLSASFETGVGLRGLVALAAVLPDVPVGLDTYRWLTRDVLQPRLPLSVPRVDVASVLNAPVHVRVDELTRVDA